MSINLSALQKQRRDTAANWTAENPTLLAGEIGLESDTGYWKVGDGATAWTSLAYVTGLGAEIPVSRLADGTARQLLQTAANGTDVEWTSNVDVPGTLDVTGAATFDAAVTIQGDLTVNGTTTTIDTQNLIVEDKNVIIGNVTTPSDVTADAGGITLKGTTDKTISWLDATDAWTLSEHVNIASGKEYRIGGTKVLDATSLGSSVLITSANITDGTIVNADVNASAAIAGTKISPDFGSQNITTTGTSTAASFIPTSSTAPTNGVYLPAANSVAISTNGTERIRIDSSGGVGIGQVAPATRLSVVSFTPTSSNLDAVFNITNDIDSNFRIFVTGSGATDKRAAIGSTTSTSLAFLTNNTERMRLDSSGRLGIGTTTPSDTLQINGGISFGVDTILANRTRIYESSGLRLDAGGGGLRPLIFEIGSTERARFDTSGRLLVGTSSARSNFFNLTTIAPSIQLEGNTTATSSLSVVQNAADSAPPSLILAKSRSTGYAVLSSGDTLGRIPFMGADGSEFVEGAVIVAEVDGTPGANDMPGRLVFSTTADGASSPTERMRITQKGGLVFAQGAVGNSFSTPAVNTTKIECDADVGHTILFNTSFGAGDRDALVWFYNSARVGSIQQNTTSVKYNTSSDYRLKENVVPVTDGIARLQQLKPSRFNFKIEPDKTVDGFIAHEVQAVVPEAISGEKDGVDKDGDPIYQGIDQSKLVPLLTAALQEAVAKIESLEARLTAAGI